jgi:O-antigen/teichoic acid export membrane protein
LTIMVSFTAVLVPRWGSIGTSLSVLARETLTLFIFAYIAFRYTGWNISRNLLLPIFLSAAALVVCILLFRNILNLWELIMVGGAIYLLVLIATGGIRLSVFRYISNVFSR